MEKSEQKTNDKFTMKPSLTPVIAILGVLIIFILSQILAANVISIVGSTQGLRGDELLNWLDRSTVARFSMYLLVVISGLAMIHLLVRKTNLKWADIGLIRLRWKDLLYALAGYGWYLPIYIVLAVVISNIFPVINLSQKQDVGFNTFATGADLVIIGFSLIILPAFYEEVLFRGVLFTGLRRKLSPIVSALILSVLFAIAHLQWSADAPLLWSAAIDTFVLSLILAYLREKTNSLWPCIGLHAIKNSVAFVVLFVFKAV